MRKKAVPQQVSTQTADNGRTKYDRIVEPKDIVYNQDGTVKEVIIDVYCVLDAFAVSCPAIQHEVKKLLCAGLRGKASELQDLQEAAVAHERAISLQISRAKRAKNA